MVQCINTKDERTRLRSTKEFKLTNKVWNKLRLNSAWRIGYLTYLCKESSAKNFEEWENFYLKSGEDRLKKIKSYSFLIRQSLTGANPYNKCLKRKMTEEEISINTKMGRTVEQIVSLGYELHKGLIKYGITNIPLTDCINFTYIRIIDETWIGTERELNTISKLRGLFPQMEVVEIPVEEDSKYAVDCEIIYKCKLLCGVQIKSKRYKEDKSDILSETKRFNTLKNEAYSEKKKAPVIYIYSGVDGTIFNEEVVGKIKSLKDSK